MATFGLFQLPLTSCPGARLNACFGKKARQLAEVFSQTGQVAPLLFMDPPGYAGKAASHTR